MSTGAKPYEWGGVDPRSSSPGPNLASRSGTPQVPIMLHPGLLEGGGTSLKLRTEASSSHENFRCPPPLQPCALFDQGTRVVTLASFGCWGILRMPNALVSGLTCHWYSSSNTRRSLRRA